MHPQSAAGKHGVEQLHAGAAHAFFDGCGDFRRRIERIDEIILQIPTEILDILRRECERERPRRGLARGAGALERCFDGGGGVVYP